MKQVDNTRRIKVFHILSNPGIGGIEGMLSNLIPRFDRTEFDVRIVNMRNESKAYELWDKVGVLYHRLPTPGRMFVNSVLGLAHLLRREKVDIVEIYGLRANVTGRLAAKLAGVPVVLTGVLSTDDWRKWHHAWLDKSTAWIVDRWIANSQACKQSLIEREKFSSELIDVIYDGIDVSKWSNIADSDVKNELRRQWGYGEKDVVFVTVANLRPDKGIQYLIEAIPKVLDEYEDSYFVLVGTDLMNGQLQRRCRELNIERHVNFVGFRSDVRDIYIMADVAVLPSLREGLPICLIEAMCMGLPVVASRVSGIPELVTDGSTGFLVPAGAPESLSDALLKMARNPEQCREMGQKGCRYVRDMFTIERMCRELTAYYKDILVRECKGSITA